MGDLWQGDQVCLGNSELTGYFAVIPQNLT